MAQPQDDFDPEAAVSVYRRVIAQLESEISEPDQAEFRRIALRLRETWKEWQGEDSLHELSFGEPTE